MGCYIWYSEERTEWGISRPGPLIPVPNVTAHPSTASVPIAILLYNGPLLCGFNVPIKGLSSVLRAYGTSPAYFKDICTTVVNTSSQVNLLPIAMTCFVSRTMTNLLGRRSFRVAAATVWNSFPLHLRSPSISRLQLRAGLNTHLCNQAYTSLWTQFVLRVNLLTYFFYCCFCFYYIFLSSLAKTLLRRQCQTLDMTILQLCVLLQVLQSPIELSKLLIVWVPKVHFCKASLPLVIFIIPQWMFWCTKYYVNWHSFFTLHMKTRSHTATPGYSNHVWITDDAIDKFHVSIAYCQSYI